MSSAGEILSAQSFHIFSGHVCVNVSSAKDNILFSVEMMNGLPESVF